MANVQRFNESDPLEISTSLTPLNGPLKRPRILQMQDSIDNLHMYDRTPRLQPGL